MGTETGDRNWDRNRDRKFGRRFGRHRPSFRGRPSRPANPSARRPATRPTRDLQDGRGQQDRTGDKPRQLHLQTNMLCRCISPLQLAQQGRALRRWLRIAGSLIPEAFMSASAHTCAKCMTVRFRHSGPCCTSPMCRHTRRAATKTSGARGCGGWPPRDRAPQAKIGQKWQK